MKITNATPKFDVAQGTDGQVAKAKELLQQDEAAYQQLLNASESVNGLSSYISLEDQAKIETEKALIQADIALLKNFIETGRWDPDAQPQVDIKAVQDQLLKMEPGWNDMQGAIAVEDDGTINLATSGIYEPTNPQSSNALAYVVPPNATKMIGKTVGNDIQLTVYFKEGATKVYTLKNMAVRPESIYIYGAEKVSGMVVDLSRVVRVSDGKFGQPFGETNGFIVWGTHGSDKLIGSQGDDILVGAGGNDAIYGMAGSDQLYGDEFGVGQFHETDGDDLLDGGDGMDTLRAGGGSKDQVIKGVGDSSAEGEIPADEVLTKPALDSVKTWLKSTAQWTTAIDATTGEIDLTLKDDVTSGGTIDLELPTGYTMASGSIDPSGQALIITLVGFDANGKPQTARVRINDFFNPGVHTTLNVKGNGGQNILDFHEVTLTGNALNLYGKGENDVVLAPKTYLDALGIDLADLGKGTYSKKQLEATVTKMRDENGVMDWGGYPWKDATNADDGAFINPDHEIELHLPDGETDAGRLDFKRPAGFTDAVLMMDPTHPNDIVIVLIDRSGARADQAIVRLKDAAGKVDPTKITMDGVPMKYVGAIPIVDGGGGTDTLYGSSASVDFINTSGDTVIEGSYDHTPTQQPVTSETKDQKKQDLVEAIEGYEKHINLATTDLNELEAEQKTLEEQGKKETDEYAQVVADIAAKQAELDGYGKEKKKADDALALLSD